MQNHSATIDRSKGAVSLVLNVCDMDYRIPLTQDSPNETKRVFNHLITSLKKGKFAFNLQDQTEDLYYFICSEYLKQLNGEIADVYSQLKKNGLTIQANEPLPG